MGFFLNESSCLIDLVEGHILATGDVDEKPPGPFNRNIFQERTGDRSLGSFHGSILTRSNSRSHQCHSCFRHDGTDVGKVQIDNPMANDNIRDPFGGMIENLVCLFKCLEQSHALPADAEESLVRDGNERIGCHPQIGQPFLSLFHPLLSFEVEGFGNDRHGESTHLPGYFSNHWPPAGACPAA